MNGVDESMEEIKIGNYVEGIEQWGPEGHESQHKMRIIVKDIHTYNGNRVYSGQADDSYGGARGGYVSTEFGEVRVITDEEPFTTKWWKKQCQNEKLTSTAWRREWKPGDLVRHFKGNKYIIVGIGVDTETELEVVIYKTTDGTDKIWVRPRAMFEDEVDKDKYPDAKQQWRFEHIKY